MTAGLRIYPILGEKNNYTLLLLLPSRSLLFYLIPDESTEIILLCHNGNINHFVFILMDLGEVIAQAIFHQKVHAFNLWTIRMGIG